jgi:two-component SAPR family response regulator
MCYKRVVIIDEDILSNILNSKIINKNLKGVITYDFIDTNFALNFLTKNLVDLIVIEKSLVKGNINKIKGCQKDTPIYVLTDKFESEFFAKYPTINSYISNPILKSNTHIIEKAIFRN